jgi:hypothetical protein
VTLGLAVTVKIPEEAATGTIASTSSSIDVANPTREQHHQEQQQQLKQPNATATKRQQ